MSLFDLPADDELRSDVRQMLAEYTRLRGAETVAPTWKTFGRHPRIVEARFKAVVNLDMEALAAFSWSARMLAVMLIAHAEGCRTCFGASRRELDKLGFDESTLDGFCANPSALPLSERDRLFVECALKLANESANLRQKDFQEMVARGLTRDEIQEIIGFVAYWKMNTLFSKCAFAALSDD